MLPPAGVIAIVLPVGTAKLSSLDSIVGIPYNKKMRAKGQKRGNATRQTNQRESWQERETRT